MRKPRYSTHKRITVPEISEWLADVETGRVPGSIEMHQLCAHVRKVFAEERLWVDTEKLARYMGYQRYFPFNLSSDEKFQIALWLCTYREGHFPRWRDLLEYVGRGYGKTGFGGFCTFCMISPANGIDFYDVDVCATTEPQAKIGYDDLYRILDGNQELFSQGFDWNKVELTNRETRSRFKYWSGNSNSKDGMRSGCVWFDEVHAYTDAASMEVFTGGLGKKEDPRRLMTTTDGDVRDGPLDELKERSERILAGDEPDNGLLPFICKLDSLDEIEDEAAWPKANPRLLRSPVLFEEYRSDVQDWKQSPQKHTAVPTKRFNLPQGRTDLQVTSWDNLLAASRPVDLEALRGATCVAGIDYAKTTDMVGACLLFHVDEEWQVVPHAWWCARSYDAGEIKAPLGEWAATGQLTIVDSPEVSPHDVARWVSSTAGALGAYLRGVSMDSYRFALMRRAVVEDICLDPDARGEDQQVWLARPSDVMRVQPVIDSAFARHAIAWGDSPLMRWATNNAKLEPAPNNCFKYGKIEPHGRKTDPFMAMVHAFVIARWLPDEEDTGVPVFASPVIW